MYLYIYIYVHTRIYVYMIGTKIFYSEMSGGGTREKEKAINAFHAVASGDPKRSEPNRIEAKPREVWTRREAANRSRLDSALRPVSAISCLPVSHQIPDQLSSRLDHARFFSPSLWNVTNDERDEDKFLANRSSTERATWREMYGKRFHR